MTWFIEDGAGIDFSFKLQFEDLNSENYCDILRLGEFLSNTPIDDAAVILDAIYGPLHVLISKSKIPSTSKLSSRLLDMEKLLASILEGSQRWRNAFRSYTRIGDIRKVSAVLDAWSAGGYLAEKPLFFARALITYLAEGRAIQAAELLTYLKSLVTDNIDGESFSSNMFNSLNLTIVQQSHCYLLLD